MKSFLLLALAPLAAYAQLTLVTFDGTNSTPVGAVYNFGNVASGDTKAVVFRVINNATSPVVVQAPAVSGFGFSITSVNGTTPYSIPPAPSPMNFLAFTVRFGGSLPASYSASLQISSISVILIANVVPAPSLTIFPPCTADPTTGAINFGNLQNGTPHGCNFSLQNPNPQPLAIASLAATGPFQATNLPATPLTLAPGQATTFALQINPSCGTVAIQGALIVNTKSYPLAASGFDPLLPKPSLTFDATAFASAEQHTLSIALPTPSACAVNGYVNLAFVSNVNGITDDSAVMFLAGSTRTLPFSVSANSMQLLINHQPSAAFQTGTTAGKITFTLSQAQINGDPATAIVIPPAPIAIELATASNQRAGELDIAITAYDNTYSAGSMSFTFFDAKGNMIGAPRNADFTSQFGAYFSSQPNNGSAFLMRASFPVQGVQGQVATVQATFTNAAGQSQTGSLTFQ
ncbi:MAG TPA: hypothetical protein VKR43_19290 [Bryobacteraceae bacterium]|nr:hypothetical protein [Bryobacteraceae bacterium]